MGETTWHYVFSARWEPSAYDAYSSGNQTVEYGTEEWPRYASTNCAQDEQMSYDDLMGKA